MFEKLNFQEILSLAYVVLVVVGIISESIFYGVLGIHYIEYTSILDALISPFSLITSNLKVFILVVVLMIFYYFYMVKFLPWIFKKTNKKEALEKIQNKRTLYSAMLFTMLIIFPSIRIGMSISYSKRLKNKTFKNNCILVFKNDTSMRVKKVGQNTSYIFYVQNGDTVVTVSPIADNIKQIKRIPKEE
ncbi:conserved membrane protein of unknown function [Tenacibaculum sp. 190130A14a]|uniref:NfeD-like C-terminal domain-containing protein n=1 Tax=Tenacibaculum polynesiense TaxID=3137857 RepID=A0ABP1F4B0_9FLAO